MAAVRVAAQLEISDSDRAAFISLYHNYKKECGEIMKVKAETGNNPETAAEQKILSDFDKSEKLLALRKVYYYRFKELIPPTKIQKMYDLERTVVRSR